jgi:hypothetical protein
MPSNHAIVHICILSYFISTIYLQPGSRQCLYRPGFPFVICALYTLHAPAVLPIRDVYDNKREYYYYYYYYFMLNVIISFLVQLPFNSQRWYASKTAAEVLVSHVYTESEAKQSETPTALKEEEIEYHSHPIIF